jgi:hypothetical protein
MLESAASFELLKLPIDLFGKIRAKDSVKLVTRGPFAVSWTTSPETLSAFDKGDAAMFVSCKKSDVERIVSLKEKTCTVDSERSAELMVMLPLSNIPDIIGMILVIFSGDSFGI